MSKKSSSLLTRGPEKRSVASKVTLRLAVDAETKRAAERLVRDYSRQNLETVLAAFVGDLAAARPGSWEHERVAAWLTSHPWPRAEQEDDLWR